MTTQFTSLFFVLLTIMSANCFRLSNKKSSIKTYLTQTYTGIVPTPENLNVLGKAAEYAVLAGSTVTNSGATTVVGSIGVSPGTAITGSLLKVVDGELHAADAFSLAAQLDLKTAYDGLTNMPGAVDKTGTYLDGLTLPPGLYKFKLNCLLRTGAFTLDAQGDANAKWVFQIATELITSVGTQVKMIGGGSALNVYWQVGTSATFKTGAVMLGNVISYSSIAFGTGASLKGRALARLGAVTMLGNVIQVKP